MERRREREVGRVQTLEAVVKELSRWLTPPDTTPQQSVESL